MSPLVAYHSSPRRHRAGILKNGLLPNRRDPSHMYGVYVYRDDYNHPTRYMHSRGGLRRVRVRWSHRDGNDLWQVSYIGPHCPDPFVENGFVLFYPPQSVSLVSQLSLVTDGQ